MNIHADQDDIGYLAAMDLQMRGVRATAPTTSTTVWRGYYAENPSLRSEFFTACELQRNES